MNLKKGITARQSAEPSLKPFPYKDLIARAADLNYPNPTD